MSLTHTPLYLRNAVLQKSNINQSQARISYNHILLCDWFKLIFFKEQTFDTHIK